MSIIKAINGADILVDEIDLDFLINLGRWSINTHRGYARKGINRKTVYMHKLVMARMLDIEKCTDMVDHINQNKLDNRRTNLRLTTSRLNNANKTLKPNYSGYRGIYKNYDKWVAQISIEGKVKHLGRFTEPQSAAKAYDKAAIEVFGDSAMLNFS